MDEFREALVKNFGSLSGAFEPLSAQCGAGRVTAAEFERFLNRLEEVRVHVRGVSGGAGAEDGGQLGEEKLRNNNKQQTTIWATWT